MKGESAVTQSGAVQTLELAQTLREAEAHATSFNHNLAYHAGIAESLESAGYRKITLDPAMVEQVARTVPHYAECFVRPSTGQCSCIDYRRRHAITILNRLLDPRAEDELLLAELRERLVRDYLNPPSRRQPHHHHNECWILDREARVVFDESLGVQTTTFIVTSRADGARFSFDLVIGRPPGDAADEPKCRLTEPVRIN